MGIKTFILVPGAVTHGTDITVDSVYLDGGKLVRVEKAILVTVDFTGTKLTTSDVTSEVSITGDNTFKLSTTDIGENQFLVLSVVVDYEPGITA